MRELSLFANPQVEILNFQTFTSEYVAERYGVSERTVLAHKARHADEIVENIHFVYELADTKGGKQEILKWTLRGIIKLGMFIRSNESKAFRIWAERELEKIILKQAQEYAETRARNLALADKVNSLEACAIKDAKDRQNQINGYKSQISQHNAVIVDLRNQLKAYEFKAEPITKIERLEADVKYYKALAHNHKMDKEFYQRKTAQAEAELDKMERVGMKGLELVLKQLDDVYTAIGAIRAFINDGDEFFMKQNKILERIDV